MITPKQIIIEKIATIIACIMFGLFLLFVLITLYIKVCQKIGTHWGTIGIFVGSCIFVWAMLKADIFVVD